MKYFLLLILVAIFATSCADDSWKAELEAIKTELANQKALIEALQNNASITGIEQGNDNYTIHFSDGQSITLTNGQTPIITIGENGNWFINGEDTGKPSQGENGENGTDGANGTDGVDGQTPTIEIGSNGNWYINGTDTGVKAEGTDGTHGIDAPYITSIVNDKRNLIFTFSDGTQLTCPLQAISNISGQTFWTLFDSFGSGNVWQNKYVELTGAIFYPQLNTSPNMPVSIGGTNSGASSLNGTLGRAKNLVNYQSEYPIDIVFIENVNDISLPIGSINDQPWMQGDKIVCHEGPLASYNEAVSYARFHLQNIRKETPISQRQRGNMLTFPYYKDNQTGTCIQIHTPAVQEGEIYLFIGKQKYSVKVNTSMNTHEIATQLSHLFFHGGWSYTNNGDSSLTLTYYTTTQETITFDGNGTGVTASVTTGLATAEYIYYFTGYSSNEWEDDNFWKTSISLYSTYKGLLEYLQSHLPETKIYWFIPSYWNVDFDDASIKNSDGSFNLALYQQTASYTKWMNLMECQKMSIHFTAYPLWIYTTIVGFH